jgi:hypothetical protein
MWKGNQDAVICCIEILRISVEGEVDNPKMPLLAESDQMRKHKESVAEISRPNGYD